MKYFSSLLFIMLLVFSAFSFGEDVEPKGLSKGFSNSVKNFKASLSAKGASLKQKGQNFKQVCRKSFGIDFIANQKQKRNQKKQQKMEKLRIETNLRMSYRDDPSLHLIWDQYLNLQNQVDIKNNMLTQVRLTPNLSDSDLSHVASLKIETLERVLEEAKNNLSSFEAEFSVELSKIKPLHEKYKQFTSLQKIYDDYNNLIKKYDDIHVTDSTILKFIGSKISERKQYIQKLTKKLDNLVQKKHNLKLDIELVKQALFLEELNLQDIKRLIGYNVDPNLIKQNNDTQFFQTFHFLFSAITTKKAAITTKEEKPDGQFNQLEDQNKTSSVEEQEIDIREQEREQEREWDEEKKLDERFEREEEADRLKEERLAKEEDERLNRERDKQSGKEIVIREEI